MTLENMSANSSQDDQELNELITQAFVEFRNDHPPVSTETAKEYEWRIKAMFTKTLQKIGIEVSD